MLNLRVEKDVKTGLKEGRFDEFEQLLTVLTVLPEVAYSAP